MWNISVILVGIMMVLGYVPSVEAGRYFDQTEMSTYTIPNSVSGDTFYVDGKNGSDTYNGLAPAYTSGTTGPFKTLAKCFDKYRSNFVVGGDVVKIKAGIYRESLSLAFVSAQISSLTATTPLSIAPYGDGEVIIDPSSTPQSWTAQDSNIYWAAWPNASYRPRAVAMNNDFKSFRDKQTLGELTRYGLWYFDPTIRRIYVNTGGVNPSTLDPVITYDATSSEQYAIMTGGYPYIHIYGLTLRGAAKYGFSDYPGGVGTKLEKCTIKWNNGNGVRIFGTYGTARQNHVWGNMMYNWPRGRNWAANGGWGQGLTVGGYGVAEGNISHDNGGEGIGVYGGTGHVIFQDNISYDNWSVGLYLDSAPYCTFQRNLVYSHNPDPTEAVEGWQLPAWIISAGAGTMASETTKIVARMRQEGIMAGDESATNPTAQSIGFKALNNIIIGARRGITTYGQATGAGLNNYVFANNTIIMPTVAPTYGDYGGISITSSANNTNSIIKNNIIYSSAPSGSTQPLVNFGSSTAMTGVDFNNNLYYSVNSATPFKSGVYPSEVLRNFTDWKAYVPTGFDTSSVYANPLFTGGSNIYSADYYVPQTLSPAIGMGASLQFLTTDFNLYAKKSPWTSGALENGSVYVYTDPPSVVTQPAGSGGTTGSADTTAPVLTGFTMPTLATALMVPINSLAATDNIGVTGYFIGESATPPASGATGWSVTAPSSFTFADGGARIAYAWAKDAVGNVSASRSAAVSITLPSSIGTAVDPGADYLAVISDNGASSLVTGNQLGQSFKLANSGKIYSITAVLSTLSASSSGGNAVLRWGTSPDLKTSYISEVKALVTNSSYAPIEFVIPTQDLVTAGTQYYFALTSEPATFNGTLYVSRINDGTYPDGKALYGSNWNVSTGDGARDMLFQVRTVATSTISAPKNLTPTVIK